MVRWYADQLQNYPEPYRKIKRDRDNGNRWYFRSITEKRSYRTEKRICIQEAHTLGIKLIGIADTNCDPEELDYVIPGNDDAIRAVKLIVSKMADAVIEANQGAEMTAEEAESVAADEAVEEA